MNCKHCNEIFEGNKAQFANHVRWCPKNPKSAKYRNDNTSRGVNLGNERFGNYK